MSITDHGITVTVKYGKGYEESWAVFKGMGNAEVRTLILDYFGVEPNAVTELTTHELVVDLTRVAQGTASAASVLSAVAIPGGKTDPPPPASGNPWAGLDEEKPEAEAEAHPFQSVIDALKAATDIPALQRVWAENQPAFKDETVVAAYKARGKELKNAA